MKSPKGIFEAEARPLPEKSYVSLSEAVTWIALDDSRDDDYIHEMQMRVSQEQLHEWGTEDGPDPLLPHLELIAEGRIWDSVSDDPEFDVVECNEALEIVRNWIERNGKDVDELIRKGKEWCKKRDREDLLVKRAYDLLFDACAGQEISLQGIRHDDATDLSVGEHGEIPFQYFLRPVEHFFGKVGRKSGMLSPTPPGDLDELYDHVTIRPDTRPNYINVMIPRDDVLMVKERFLEAVRDEETATAPPPPRRRYSPARLESWYKKRIANWPEDKIPPTREEDIIAAQAKFPGAPRDAVRELRLKLAPENWQKRGRRSASRN